MTLGSSLNLSEVSLSAKWSRTEIFPSLGQSENNKEKNEIRLSLGTQVGASFSPQMYS